MERIFKGIILASYNPFFPSARFFTNDQRNGHNVCSELTRFHFWTVVFIWKFASSRCLFRNEKKYRTGKGTEGKKYRIDSREQRRVYFFWKHRRHLVSPSSFVKRMEKQYFDVSCPQVFHPLIIFQPSLDALFLLLIFFTAILYPFSRFNMEK